MFAGIGIIALTLPALSLKGALLLAFAPVVLALAAKLPSQRRRGSSRDPWRVFQTISAQASGAGDLSTALDASLTEILKVMEMQAGAIRVSAGSDAPPVAVYKGFGKAVADGLESGLLEACAETSGRVDRSLTLDDLPQPCRQTLGDALQGDGYACFAFRPLRAAGRLLGVLVLASREAKSGRKGLDAYLAALTEAIGAAIVTVRMREQAHKLSEDLIALREVVKIISQTLDQKDIIRRIVIEGRRLVKTQQCHLFLYDERRQVLIGSASTQEVGLEIREVEIRLSEDSAAVQAFRQKRVIAVEDIPGLEPGGTAALQPMGWRAGIFAPLIAKEQVGVLICSNDSAGRTFTHEEISRAETLAHQAAIALENARLFQVVARGQREWESTFDAMQDCVSLHDTSGKIIRANRALARRLNTTPREIIGKYCSEVYNPPELSFSPCRHTDILQSERPVVEEVELSAMGGTFQVSVSPWYDNRENRLLGSIHVAKDISNEKLLRQQLIQSEKLSAIGELISGIAHELNNPLTGVMGYSQLLQLRKDLDERVRESLLKINNLAMRCQKIVQNLLSFARKQKPERTMSSVNDILERTIELRNYELAVNNIEIVRELDRNLPKTIADSHQLQQVFLNVITNAEYAMLQAHGRGRLVIRSRPDHQNNRIVVEIADDGPGIPEAQIPKIFDPFFTTKEVGKGTGLGLSLSYGIIKEHGGNIYAVSRPGEGATFFIELPIISRLLEDVAVYPELLPQALQFDNLVRNKRILIVDDERYILDFFIEIFKMFPMQVDTAGDGRVAMEMLANNEYDLIITDFKMPQMNGRELFQWIQEKRPQLARRIIFITGDTVSADTQSFFENNSNLYLAKPFKIEEVKEVIQQTLENNSTQ
jgi:two-component system NtrC family sensor kinase